MFIFFKSHVIIKHRGDKMRLSEKIYKLRQDSKLSQNELAQKLGVAQASINYWEKGQRTPSADMVALIADFFHVSADYLMGLEYSTPSSKKGITINVLGRVAAGVPIEAIEGIIDTEEITEKMAKTGSFFGLQIHGDSMEPRIYEGDIVIVRKQDDAESGDVVIAMINGDDATCKRLRKYRDGIELVAINPSYEPMFFSNEDIAKKPVKIIGKVVELRGKL